MSTGQMYSGEGEDATQPQENGSNFEPAVNSDPQAASSAESATKPTLITEAFNFDELVLFNSLSETGKTIISALVNSGRYQPEVLKRALLHISQTPDTASPNEVFNGESLRTILTGKSPQSEALAQSLASRITQISGVLSHDGRTYVRLTDYLEQVTNSEAGIEAFRNQLLDIICEYKRSRKFMASTDPDKDAKVTDLHCGISLLIARVGCHKTNPVPNPASLTAIDSLERPLEPAGYEILLNEASSISDTEPLQEWIARLQFMNRSMMEINANLNLMLANRNELVEVMKAKLDEYEELIPRLKAKIPDQKAPQRSSTLTHSFQVTTHHKGTSQADILYFALIEYRDSRRKQYQEGMQEGEFENAYVDFDDYQTAQTILDELQLSSLELANQNYQAHVYRGDDERFRSERITDARLYQKDYSAFLALHGITSTEDPSTDTPPAKLTPKLN